MLRAFFFSILCALLLSGCLCRPQHAGHHKGQHQHQCCEKPCQAPAAEAK